MEKMRQQHISGGRDKISREPVADKRQWQQTFKLQQQRSRRKREPVGEEGSAAAKNSDEAEKKHPRENQQHQ